MPKFLIRNTADNSLTTVDGVLPLDLKLTLNDGTYAVSALSDTETSVTIGIILSNFVDNLNQNPPALAFDSTSAGTATWDFHSSATAPAPGFGDIDTGTFAVTAGANNTTIDLTGNEGQTGYLHFTVTDGVSASNVLTSQVITVAASGEWLLTLSGTDLVMADAQTLTLTGTDLIMETAA